MNYFKGSGMAGLCIIKNKLDLTKNIKKVVGHIKIDRTTITKDNDTISTTNINSRR